MSQYNFKSFDDSVYSIFSISDDQLLLLKKLHFEFSSFFGAPYGNSELKNEFKIFTDNMNFSETLFSGYSGTKRISFLRSNANTIFSRFTHKFF